jgi:ABC-type sugar transport system permease subunit
MYLRIADGQFGYASAIGVILCAVVAVGVFFNQRYQRRQADF